jgi:hypothetical protein
LTGNGFFTEGNMATHNTPIPDHVALSLESLFEALAISADAQDRCQDDLDLPQVDLAVVDAYADRTLPEESERLVAGLIIRDKGWRDAYEAALLKRANDTAQSSPAAE